MFSLVSWREKLQRRHCWAPLCQMKASEEMDAGQHPCDQHSEDPTLGRMWKTWAEGLSEGTKDSEHPHACLPVPDDGDEAHRGWVTPPTVAEPDWEPRSATGPLPHPPPLVFALRAPTCNPAPPSAFSCGNPAPVHRTLSKATFPLKVWRSNSRPPFSL